MINTEKILKRAKTAFVFNSDFLGEYLPYGEFETLEDLVQYLENCSDEIHEYADSMIDIYYYDLRKWAVDNYQYIEEAIDELGAPEPFDFHKAIQFGQYHKYCQDIYEDCSKFVEYIKDNYNL